MQFNLHEIRPADCAEVEVRLKHAGKMPAKVMGHDWVLARLPICCIVIRPRRGLPGTVISQERQTIIAATKWLAEREAVVRLVLSLLSKECAMRFLHVPRTLIFYARHFSYSVRNKVVRAADTPYDSGRARLASTPSVGSLRRHVLPDCGWIAGAPCMRPLLRSARHALLSGLCT